MTVEKIWISPFIYSTLQWPGVCRTRRQRANFMTFSMIVYHIPSHMVGGTFYDIQLLSHSAAAEFCGVKIPTNRGMLEEGRGHIQGDSPILAPEKPIALGIGDPPPSVGKVSHIFPFFCTTSGMQDWLGALKLRSSAQIDHISPPPYCKICFSTSESFWHAQNN